MGTPCVSGAGEIKIDYAAKVMRILGREIKEGDVITIDGGTGEVMAGAVATIQPELAGDFAQLMEWADANRTMGVRANAETPLDARTARDFGAEGIGLARTEHMFFETEERRLAIQEMIVADDETSRRKALKKLLPFQRSDFVGIFKAMNGRPVTIRLVDPPLHEFLPHGGEDSRKLAASMGMTRQALAQIVESLRESNPMLGHRGCRLGITYPEITEMQVRAILEAAGELVKEGKKAYPEIMIPVTCVTNELADQKVVVERVYKEVLAKLGISKIPYMYGTMIEIPRAALLADRMAAEAEFFSFGTNALTQTTYGISRDDADTGPLVHYMQTRLLKDNPFTTIDANGVGRLMQIAIEEGRKAREGLEIGVCGEHGGDPKSIHLCHQLGVDYVSCSPFRVPIARLAAAQAALG